MDVVELTAIAAGACGIAAGTWWWWWRRRRRARGPGGDDAALTPGAKIVCPRCGKRTPWSPPPAQPLPPGMSYPHLRCRHCGAIVG